MEGYIPSKSGDADWSQTDELGINYVDNRIESVMSDFYNGVWYQQRVKVDIFTSQDLVDRSLNYNYNPDLDDWEEDRKAEFHGDGIHLSSIKYFEWEGGGWLQNKKIDYEYLSGNLSSNKEYQWAMADWLLTKDCSMQYNEGYLYEVLESRPNQGMEYKFVLSYAGNSLLSINKYLDNDGNWMDIETQTFEYDPSGNLIKYETVHHQHQIVDLYEYSYTKGGHNLNHYLQSENIFHYPFPLPYPVLLIN